MTLLLTREALIAAHPCWLGDADGLARIHALVPAKGLPVTRASVEAARKLGVSDSDIHWALCYACGVPDRILRESACASARRALEAERAAGREPDARSWRVVEVAERYARGEATDDELAASRDASDAAWAASRAARAASDAAWAASRADRAAAWAASRAAWDASDAARAASAAARDASWAAWDAAWAASDAAWAAAVEDLMSRIEVAS